MFVVNLAKSWGFIQDRGLNQKEGLKRQLSLSDALEYLLALTISAFSGWVLANLFADTGIPHRGLDPVFTHSDWSLQGRSILTTFGVVALFVTIHFAWACFKYVAKMTNLKTSKLFKSLLVILICLNVASLWVEYGNGIPEYDLYFENAVEFDAVWIFSAFMISVLLELIRNRSKKFKQG
jgi:hypothetical protein